MRIDSDQDGDHDACRADSSRLRVQFYQYHIVYLPPYSVPVLLFKAHNEGAYNFCEMSMLHQCAVAIIVDVAAFLT